MERYAVTLQSATVSKVDKTEISEQVAASIRNFSERAKGEGARRGVIDMPEYIQKKAALISAHFLLPAGARVVDMGCETGEITYALAALNPRAEIIGVDRDQKSIEFARKNYRLPNLSYQESDIAIPNMEDDSVDGIINSNILHHVYSMGGYNPGEVTALLEKQMQKLKTGGTMLIRDYMMPPEGEFVLLELPNLPSEGDTTADLSDADLLVNFSQTARPMASGCEGFFIEELMPRRDGTRLFRLPHKWALEFIHRKSYRKDWENELKEEYTFFTYQDYRREFARLGMRMVFSAPYSNPWVVKNCFKGRFQLYDEDYAPLGTPATNYFIVAQKVADKQSLVLEERRPSQKPVGDLQIMIVRDKKTGALHELVKRPGEYCDIVPYRITPDNRLVIYVRSGYPRPIVNAVSRGSHNLDGKKWSGHLIEPITMDTVNMTDDVEENRKMIFGYVDSYASLRAKSDESWYVGDTYFPSPDRIDEAIEPVFIEVENPQKPTWPIKEDKEVNFT
ncbi:MAG: methyltransferase domain-containing protein, partial [Alphaproteobacteria bacterium]